MYWNYGISIDHANDLRGPEAQNFESVVRMQLSWIDESEVGRLLLLAIARNVLNGAPHDLAVLQGPIRPGHPSRGVQIRPYTGDRCNAQEDHSVVSYSPYTIGFGACHHLLRRASLNRGLFPNEVLFHELVHALRDAAGHGQSLTALGGGLTEYGNTEEFIAVVVTNVYMTDPTNRWATGDRVGLRRDHGFGKLPDNLAQSLDFYASAQRTFELIDQFCREDAWFAQKLARTKSTFNPLTVYFDDQANARSRSNSAAARQRDAAAHP